MIVYNGCRAKLVSKNVRIQILAFIFLQKTSFNTIIKLKSVVKYNNK